MNYVKILYVVLFVFCTSTLKSQVELYRTYKDFLNESGEEYTDVMMAVLSSNGVTFRFFQGEEKTKVKSKAMWGFKFKGVLFRSDIKNNTFMCVMSTDKIVYYTHGQAYFDKIRGGTDRVGAVLGYGNYAYLSEEINSELYYITGAQLRMMKGEKTVIDSKELGRLESDNPEYASLCKCISNVERLWEIDTCVQKFVNDD